jgi:hypothetical protein
MSETGSRVIGEDYAVPKKRANTTRSSEGGTAIINCVEQRCSALPNLLRGCQSRMRRTTGNVTAIDLLRRESTKKRSVRKYNRDERLR